MGNFDALPKLNVSEILTYFLLTYTHRAHEDS